MDTRCAHTLAERVAVLETVLKYRPPSWTLGGLLLWVLWTLLCFCAGSLLTIFLSPALAEAADAAGKEEHLTSRRAHVSMSPLPFESDDTFFELCREEEDRLASHAPPCELARDSVDTGNEEEEDDAPPGLVAPKATATSA